MRPSPWMAWRRYVAGSSGAMKVRRPSVEGEHIADFLRPLLEPEAVRLEEGQRDALEAEAHARAVRHGIVGRLDVEHGAEMVEVVVARADRRGLFRRADRDHQLELERLLALDGLLHLA